MSFTWAFAGCPDTFLSGAGGPLGAIQYKTAYDCAISGTEKFVWNTGSNSLHVQGDVNITGTLTANQYNVKITDKEVTNLYSSGNSSFGDTADDRHDFTGSLIVSGTAEGAPALYVTGAYGASAGGAVGINTDDPKYPLHILDDGVGYTGSLLVLEQRNNSADAGSIWFKKSRGATTVAQAGDEIGEIFFGSRTRSDLGPEANHPAAAGIIAQVPSDAGTISSANQPGELSFYTVEKSSTSLRRRIFINANGNVGIGVGRKDVTLKPKSLLHVSASQDFTGSVFSVEGSNLKDPMFNITGSRVGINNIGPRAQLDICSSGSTEAIIEASQNQTARIRFYHGPDGGNGSSYVKHSNLNNFVVENEVNNGNIEFYTNKSGDTDRQMVSIDGGEAKVGVKMGPVSAANTSTANVPHSTMHVSGSWAGKYYRFAPAAPQETYVVDAADANHPDYIIGFVNGKAYSLCQVTLPDASDFPGRILIIKDEAGTTGTTPLLIHCGESGDIISGEGPTYKFGVSYGSITLYSDGVNQWHII